jgi:hypothetical protein
VALVHSLEEGHLGRAGQVHVLCAVRYELHESASHFSIRREKKTTGIWTFLLFFVFVFCFVGVRGV